MDDSPVEEYRNKMLDWGLPLSLYSQQCQACFAPQSGSGLDIVENTEQGRQANQCRYPRPERRYSVFRNHGTVAPEYSRLEKILEKTSEELKDAPSGKLRLSSSNKCVQYYHCVPGERKNGQYLPREKKKLAYRLAQKSYDEKIMKLAEKRLSQIRRITEDYDEEEIEKIFLTEHPERQKLIKPAEPVWEQRLSKWAAEDYKRKEFQEDAPVILTEKGERVRSKSEKILADYFYRNGILYKYECPLYLKRFGTVHPDFTFLSRKTKQEIYWEHDGRMDDPVYAQNAIRKIQAYEENDIYPGERLILTFETDKTILNTRQIERLVRRYLL